MRENTFAGALVMGCEQRDVGLLWKVCREGGRVRFWRGELVFIFTAREYCSMSTTRYILLLSSCRFLRDVSWYLEGRYDSEYGVCGFQKA